MWDAIFGFYWCTHTLWTFQTGECYLTQVINHFYCSSLASYSHNLVIILPILVKPFSENFLIKFAFEWRNGRSLIWNKSIGLLSALYRKKKTVLKNLNTALHCVVLSRTYLKIKFLLYESLQYFHIMYGAEHMNHRFGNPFPNLLRVELYMTGIGCFFVRWKQFKIFCKLSWYVKVCNGWFGPFSDLPWWLLDGWIGRQLPSCWFGYSHNAPLMLQSSSWGPFHWGTRHSWGKTHS